MQIWNVFAALGLLSVVSPDIIQEGESPWSHVQLALPQGIQALLSCHPNACVYACVHVCVRGRERQQERETWGSIPSRQEVCYSQREREQDTQQRERRVNEWGD